MSRKKIYSLPQAKMWGDLYIWQKFYKLGQFKVHGSVHRNNSSNIYPTRCKIYTVYFIWKLLYMSRLVPPPIIRSTNNCIYSIWYLSHRYCYLPLSRQVAGSGGAPNDGWWYHSKHVEQFPDKINCVTLRLVGYILEYYYDEWTHER